VGGSIAGMTDLSARLGKLPAAIAEPMQRVLSLAQDEPTEEFDLAVEEALTAAGFAPSEGKSRVRAVPPASELSPEQRTLAELLSEIPQVWLTNWPLYCTPWLRRRWLGLEPAGVLFRTIELELDGATERRSLIEALRRYFATDERARGLALLDELPLADRVEALVGLLLLDDPDFNVHDISELSLHTSAQLADAQTCPGAAALTDWAIGLRGEGQLPERVAMLLFAALVADGVPIEPRHDALLCLSAGDHVDLGRRCLAAIPEPRREPALLAAVERIKFSSQQVRVGLAYLPHFPYPSLARLVLAKHDKAHDPKQVLAELQLLAEEHDALGPVLAAFHAGTPTLPQLRVGTVLEPVTLAALDDVRRRQLEIANRLYGGGEASAATILAREEDEDEDECISPAFLELRMIVDEHGTPVYDAWLYMVDSGTVFMHASTDVVAEVIQFGVETKDKVLRLMLPSVLGRVD
jgi:hypothetical protein